MSSCNNLFSFFSVRCTEYDSKGFFEHDYADLSPLDRASHNVYVPTYTVSPTTLNVSPIISRIVHVLCSVLRCTAYSTK